MNQIIRLFIIVIVVFTGLKIAFAKVEENFSVDNKSTYHLGDDIDLVSTSDVKYYKPRIIIKMIYPRLTSVENKEKTIVFNEQVKKILNEEIAMFKKKVAEKQEYQKTLEKSKVRNRLTIDFNSAVVSLEDRPIISVRFIIQGYITGMKNPVRRHRVLNYDIDEGNHISLAELFYPDADYLNVLATFSNNILGKKLRGDPLVVRDVSADEEYFRNWNITPGGIRITFDEDTIAPVKYGSQKILVPYSAIKSILDPNTVLGYCLKHRRRCMGDNLLTGGFIDEATNTRNSALNPSFG